MTALLETYFSEVLDGVRAAGGEVTEVMGDGLLALFEADDTRLAARAALRAALGGRRRTEGLNGRRRRHDPVTVNMGLNAGGPWSASPVCAGAPGNAGCTRQRGR